jgi:hypothetical protein
MKARDINFILDHMRDNVKVLTPDTLNNAKFAVIINSAPFMNAFQISETPDLPSAVTIFS